MPKDNTLKYRDLIRMLDKYGIMEVKARGKGSHRGLIGIASDGKRIFFTIVCHNEGQDVWSGIVRKIRQKFGISYEEFYDNRI